MNRSMKMKELGPITRLALAVVLMTLGGLVQSSVTRADTLLLASTDLVSGTSNATYSFDAPSAGTVTARLTSVAWPVPLTSLSFTATSATSTLASWQSGGSAGLASAAAYSPADTTDPAVETFQVGAGTYFAHVMATAGGDLNLGLYSLMLTFTPSAVPLPSAAALLIIGIIVLSALRGTMRTPGTRSPRNESVMYPA
jgi:hypothetical protein